MYTQLFSQSWYRVAQLKPRLRTDAQWSRQKFRGETWYVLRELSSGKVHRFSMAAKLVIERMDGRQNLHAIWEAVCAQMGDDMPAQDEVIQLLAQLHRSNLLHADTLPDMEELSRRKFREDRQTLLQYLKSPMALRLPLWNPQQVFRKLNILAVLFFNRISALLFCLLLLVAGLQAAQHWQALSHNFQDQAFSASNWLLIALVYPFVKLLHEFGHGLAIRRWGGEVRELGLMFLVFIPVPYVDASEASLFHRKHQRIVVSLAGIFTELTLASIALLLWINAEPGVFRALLFNIMLIGGISTVLFNGNPLLKFDAYFALADYLELPNLAQRSNKYLGYLVKRYALRLEEISPVNDRREASWFVVYGIASFLYRMTVMLAIALFVAAEFFFIGVLLAFWTLYQSLIAPTFRMLKHTWRDSLVRHYRPRLLLFASGSAGVVLLLFAVLPLPRYTLAQGIYWAPDHAQIRAGADCFVTDLLVDTDQYLPQGTTHCFVIDLLVDTDQYLPQGTTLLRCESAELRANLSLVTAQLAELQARYRALMKSDLNEAEILREEISRVEEELQHARQRLAATEIKTNRSGIVRLQNPGDLPGKFVRRGTYLGYIEDEGVQQTRVAIPQAAIAAVRADIRNLTVREANNLFEQFEGQILRELPQASTEIPSLALTTEGGGEIVVDPMSRQQAQALENWFQFDVVVSEPGRVGTRVYLRFEHSKETLYNKLYRKLRAVFLEQFSV